MTDIGAEILRGMAQAFFAVAYADQAEEAGHPLRGEIMDQLPEITDPAAVRAALWLAERLGDGSYGLCWLYRSVELCWRFAEDKGDRELSPELFGHYCAMQAMGTGVGLDSFGEQVYLAVQVPYLEFGSYHLDRDYFETPI